MVLETHLATQTKSSSKIYDTKPKFCLPPSRKKQEDARNTKGVFYPTDATKVIQLHFVLKDYKKQKIRCITRIYSGVTCAAKAEKVEQLGLVFWKMHDQAYDGAVNMTGKMNGVAAFMLTDNQKRAVKCHVLNVFVANACVVIKLCLYHDFIDHCSGELHLFIPHVARKLENTITTLMSETSRTTSQEATS